MGAIVLGCVMLMTNDEDDKRQRADGGHKYPIMSRRRRTLNLNHGRNDIALNRLVSRATQFPIRFDWIVFYGGCWRLRSAALPRATAIDKIPNSVLCSLFFSSDN